MEDTRAHPRPMATIWFPLALMLLVLTLRVLAQHGMIPNVNLSPLMALAFVGAIVVPRPLPWWSWALILLGVDVLSQGAQVWRADNLPVIALTYTCYILAAWWGGRMRASAGITNTLAGTLLCSALFYLVTNTFCWATTPYYAKSFAGWIEALTVGSPGPWPTTLMFFRNSLMADLTGACVLLLAYNGEAVLRGLRSLPWIGRRQLHA
jgi:hypothetical protein